MTATQPTDDDMSAYLARKEAHKKAIVESMGRYTDTHDVGQLRAEHTDDARRQAKRDARHAAGKLNEHEEQQLVVEYLEAGGHRVFAVCNGVVFGMPREAACRYAAYLRAEGRRRGVPDLWIGPNATSRVWTVLEMKQVGGAEPTPEQREWLDYCESTGMRALVAFGHEQAIERLREAGY